MIATRQSPNAFLTSAPVLRQDRSRMLLNGKAVNARARTGLRLVKNDTTALIFEARNLGVVMAIAESPAVGTGKTRKMGRTTREATTHPDSPE